jgi:Bacterial capsule synthesis protein PGA_cap
MYKKLTILAVGLMLGSLFSFISLPPVTAQTNNFLNFTPECGSGEADQANFTLAAAGDLLLHYNIQDTANLLGYDYLFDEVRYHFSAADFSYVNFEGVIAPGQEAGQLPYFAYSPKLTDAVKNAGVDIISTANNHAMDRGWTATDFTIDYLNQIGLPFHGTNKRGDPRPPYQPFEIKGKNGITLNGAFISVTYSTNGIPDPYNQVNMLWDNFGQVRQEILAAVKLAKQERDLVVAAVHWGNEYETEASEQQKRGAKALAEAGVDILLGDHPHVVQPIDLIETNGRKTLIIYSLGNFMAAQEGYRAHTQTSLIFYAGVNKKADGTTTVTGYRYLPVYIANNTRPVPIRNGQYAAPRAQILSQMRDPQGWRAVSPDFGSEVAICPTLKFKEVPNFAFEGDFARYFLTLGDGNRPVDSAKALSLVGLPVSEVREELAGDCKTSLKVQYTERQRLEWHAGNKFPYRIIGTQLGTQIYYERYASFYPGAAAVPRLTDLEGAISDPIFKAFFRANGGVAFFGYPLSGLLVEKDPTSGREKTVQYFERARFELAGEAGQYRVELGLLGREYRGINFQCISTAGAQNALLKKFLTILAK